MMSYVNCKAFYRQVSDQLSQMEQVGTYKAERLIDSHQSVKIRLANGQQVYNFCANNYLGLADDPELIQAAKQGLDQYGYGAASVRFICGTQTPHQQLEATISEYLGMDETIVFPSCFDANGGVFESLLGPEDAVISDQLNHASIIDGIRLCKAKRYRYANNDMAELEQQLKQADADGARYKLIVTDGVFSMDGIIANLPVICQLAQQYQALVMVDDSHATGFMGHQGKGTPSFCGVEDQVDIITGTLGKALGGASGGFVAAKAPIAQLLKQKARPYLFSNALAPALAHASITAVKKAQAADTLRSQLKENQRYFRAQMEQAGFDLIDGEHAIIPVMIYDENKAVEMADALLAKGIYVIAFSYPVVPKGLARIRTQMSAAHTKVQIDQAVEAFTEAGRQLGLIK